MKNVKLIRYMAIAEVGDSYLFGEAKGELKKRFEENNPTYHIEDVDTADQMTDRQIAAKVREYFQ